MVRPVNLDNRYLSGQCLDDSARPTRCGSAGLAPALTDARPSTTHLDQRAENYAKLILHQLYGILGRTPRAVAAVGFDYRSSRKPRAGRPWAQLVSGSFPKRICPTTFQPHSTNRRMTASMADKGQTSIAGRQGRGALGSEPGRGQGRGSVAEEGRHLLQPRILRRGLEGSPDGQVATLQEQAGLGARLRGRRRRLRRGHSRKRLGAPLPVRPARIPALEGNAATCRHSADIRCQQAP